MKAYLAEPVYPARAAPLRVGRGHLLAPFPDCSASDRRPSSDVPRSSV